MNYTIKEYTTSDENNLFSMIKEFYALPAVLHSIPDSNIKNTLDLLNKKSPFANAYILMVDDNYAGYVLLAFTYSNEAGGNVMWIEEIYIKKEYRKKGLSKIFVEFIINEYPDISRLRLEIIEGNKESLGLFSSFEFEELKYIQFVKEKTL